MDQEDMLKVLSGLVSIPVAELKVMLGIPLSETCPARTVQEASFCYHSSPIKSEKQAAAILRWIDLCSLEEIGNVVVWGVFVSIAHKKREELALRRALGAKHIDDARIAYIHAPPGGEAQSTALKIWNGFSLKQAMDACTLKQAMHAYADAHEQSGARAIAFEKWVRFCSSTDTEEITNAYYHAPKDSPLEQLALKKLEKLFTGKIVAASTREEVEAICRHIPEDTGVRKLALKKREEFFLREVENARSVEQAESVYLRTAKHGEASTAAIKKIFDLLVACDAFSQTKKNKGGAS